MQKQVAFTSIENKLFFAEHEPSSNEPHSALVRLIQGLYQIEPARAMSHLRKPIFVNYELSAMCLGMLRVCAKRIRPFEEELWQASHNSRVDLSYAYQASPSPIPKMPSPIEQLITNQNWMPATLALAASVEVQNEKFLSSRKIAALLVSAENQILAWNANSNASNRTLHAEVKMLQSYFLHTGRPIPKNSKIFTSMKPCKMCAGMIWQMSEDPNFTFLYFYEDDEGRFSKNTVYDQRAPHCLVPLPNF